MPNFFNPGHTMVPDLNHEGLLPPFIGDADGPFRSPYWISIEDLIQRFGTSKRRCDILRGYVTLRNLFFHNGFSGFQWVAGSFVEKRMEKFIETPSCVSEPERVSPSYIEHEPGDIDVVSFVTHIMEPVALDNFLKQYNVLKIFGSKKRYSCDSFIVDISCGRDKAVLIEQTTYWYSLFSHTREKVWKGMLRLPLAESNEEFNECMALIDRRENDEPTR